MWADTLGWNRLAIIGYYVSLPMVQFFFEIIRACASIEKGDSSYETAGKGMEETHT